MKHAILTLILCSIATLATAQPVTTVAGLLEAVSRGTEGTVIDIGEGTFRLSQPLDLKSGMTLKGAGIGKTIVTHTPEWKAATDTLPDPETNHQKFDRSGYLIRFADKATAITLADMTLTGPQLHGAIFGFGNKALKLRHLRIEDFMYSGIRTYSMSHAEIHDCTFVDAGQRWERGKPGVKGGITGGGIFVIWMSDSEIWNNRFLRTKTAPNEHCYGIKGRQGKRCHIHHNTIETNFSIEFPFENDEDVEIDHNICHGTISIPKHAGGPVPASGRTFHIHHNLFRDTYSIEFVRNGVEIDHNLFDFDPAKDHGNTISGFGKAAASGPAQFHNNLVSNPGRGVIWINEPFNRLEVRNNHIITRTTATPRREGFFGFNAECDFKTFRFTGNLIECIGQARPLFRNDASAAIAVENNQLINVSDAARYANPRTGTAAGLEQPLAFRCGVDGEVMVDGWKTRPAGVRQGTEQKQDQ
jgi:nitrous oxidase accessory protein